MQLHFLKAADNTPLTKTFTKESDGTITKTSYPPHLFKVTSQAFEIADIEAFYKALKGAADNGFALQKGELDAQLVNESRANHTLTDKPTEWVLFDIDGLPAIESVEAFIKTILPSPFHDVSYIVQYSSSHGIVDKGLSAHLFFLLEQTVRPDDLKNWLRLINLQNPVLESALSLQTGNKSALRWPLDVTVAGNDKYIYIAPPVCEGFEDPLGDQRIQLVQKTRERAAFSFDNPGRGHTRQLERAKIQQLRDGEQLPKMSLQTSPSAGFDVLLNADKVEVTEWWFSNGYYHLNLNGGDSGAYWVNPKRPKFLRSFKDEPARILKQVAPEFWNEIKDDCAPDEMLVFRDEITDRFYTGWYNPIEDEHTDLFTARKQNISDWCEFHFDASAPDPIPQYKLVFDPTKDFAVDRQARLVNLFQKTSYMRLAPDANATVPPTIKKVIDHVMNYDEGTIEWFLNWLAYIFQYRKKTMTAVVFHGTKGTGKGVLFSHVIKPLLGDQAAQSIQQRDIVTDRFNEFLRRSLVVMLDESEADENFRDKLFHWITEPKVRLRLAYTDGQDIQSYTNFILSSNKPDGAPIEVADRRFTVAPRQMVRLYLTEDEINEDIPSELSQFARFLLAYEVDTLKAIRPHETDAKESMREAARDTIGAFVEAIEQGDITYFLELMDAAGSDNTLAAEAAITRWAKNVNIGKPTGVSMSELASVYRFVSQSQMPPAKFKTMMIKRGIPKPVYVQIKDRSTRGIEVEWKASARDLAAYEHIIGSVRAETVGDDIERAVLKLGNSKE